MSEKDMREYSLKESVVFFKTKDAFGGLSNMASGFPLCVNGVNIKNAEALYQVCKFPDYPELQAMILNEKSPISAKRIAKENILKARKDWLNVRVNIMRWCLRVKLFQNTKTFKELLLATKNTPIIERSRKDDFWGAKLEGENLIGMNILGRLLMELREDIKNNRIQFQTPNISNFSLLGKGIKNIEFICQEREDLFE